MFFYGPYISHNLLLLSSFRLTLFNSAEDFKSMKSYCPSLPISPSGPLMPRKSSELDIFDREQRSKVLKEAFLMLFLFLFLAWNQVKKMFVGTKNVHGNKKCSWEQKMFVGTKNVRGNKKCS